MCLVSATGVCTEKKNGRKVMNMTIEKVSI